MTGKPSRDRAARDCGRHRTPAAVEFPAPGEPWTPERLALIPLADCETGQLDALIAQLNLRSFAVLAQAMTDEPADRPDTLDETA